ncbi:MAG: hypothetical protein FWD73_06805 [Polyangiaceae bacterium]|nr:hypothetical protein [Polyangiaceae bacterium]
MFSVVTSGGMAACSHTTTPAPDNSDNAGDNASPRRDGGVVDAPDGGSSDGDAGTPALPPRCDHYCKLVMDNCQGDAAQYESEYECLKFCAHMPDGKAGDTNNNSLACRQFYAGSPALTDAITYCLAAGPFGGGTCGDRCTSFCQLASTVCFPDTGLSELSEAGVPPYDSLPACATACAAFDYEQANADGGGEGPEGPSSGNTLNCRLYELRQIIVQTSTESAGCENLAPNSPTCQ